MFDKHALSLWLKKIGISYKVKKQGRLPCPVSYRIQFIFTGSFYDIAALRLPRSGCSWGSPHTAVFPS